MRSRCAARRSCFRRSAGRARGFRPGPELGVGDDEFSYAYDGDRCKLWHDTRHDDFGRAWEAGDVVGYLDLDEGIILFTVNGHLVEFDDEEEDGTRPAFDGVSPGRWFPALTLKSGTCRVNFGERDLDHPEALDWSLHPRPWRLRRRCTSRRWTKT